MGRDRRPPADPQWGRHLRGEGRCAHVALGRQPPDRTRATIEVLVRPGDPQAQGDRLGQAELRLRSGAPMTDYREADFSRLKTVPIAQRPNKVDPSLLAHPPRGDPSFTAFWDSLPDILAAKDLRDRKSTRLNSSHTVISYAVFCLKKKKNKQTTTTIQA